MRLFIFLLALHIQLCCGASSSPDFNSSNLSNNTIIYQSFPIETIFKLPSPLPSWPPGTGFGSGTIDLGGLIVTQISNFNLIWATLEGGPDNLGASFYEPTSIPDGFFMLGSFAQPNNKPLFGWVLAAKDLSNTTILTNPIDYTLVWSSEYWKLKQNGVAYLWLPVPPEGYNAVGHVITNSPEKPPLDKIRVVKSEYTDVSKNGDWIWGNSNGINIYESRPSDIGSQAVGVPTGTFLAENNGGGDSLSCLKNVNHSLSSMPNLNQINALVQEYSPFIYLHPDEQFLPSSVNWFFQNGALLYTKGQESNPTPIEINGSNLPQSGSNDGQFWIDLPNDKEAKDRVAKGDLPSATAYLHVKPMLGGTFTDIALWVFYPYNGAAKAKIEFITISLGRIGEHVGDWEHVTLRISNFNGELKNVYFAQHGKGIWVSSSKLEFENNNRPVVYSSFHGHAAFPNAGEFVHMNGHVGIGNETDRSNMVMDTSLNFAIVCADYLEEIIVEPPWLNYASEWGPKISYDINEEIKNIEKFLPGKLKTAFENFIRGLPKEMLGEEGPTGPKWKDSWSWDERA